MTGRVYNMDLERARRRPFAQDSSSRDCLARVFVMEAPPVEQMAPNYEAWPWLGRLKRYVAIATFLGVVHACAWFREKVQ